MSELDCDVIVVGSGPAGVSAAWPLVEAGFGVTMIDAAAGEIPAAPAGDLGTFRRAGEGWRHAFGDDLAGVGTDGEQSPKFATRIGRKAIAGAGDPPAIVAENFLPVRSAALGGLSTIWGALASAFDDADLDGFPIAAADLGASYRRLAKRMGLSGAEDDLADFHGAGLALQRPTWMSPIAAHLLRRYERARPTEFELGAARNAVITEARPERAACNRCGLCLYGCARGAIYSSTFDLERLRAHPNFRYLGGSRVVRLIEADAPGVAIDAKTATPVMRGRALLLAAGTLNTTALILGLAGAAGRPVRLLTNPVGASAYLVPSLVGRPLAERGFSLGQLSYRIPLGDPGEYAAGVLYTVETLPLSALARKLPLSRPAALSVARLVAPAVLAATLYLPGRFSSNRLALEGEAPGGPRLKITGETTAQARRLLIDGMRRLARALRGLGAYALPGSRAVPVPGTDAHLAGTLPMSETGGPLTATADCEVRPWRNIYVVDGSCLSALPAKHATFTIMANADRVGHIVAARLEKPLSR